MTIQVTVKLDDNKIRVYLKSNDATIESIEDYLKAQGYNNVASVIAVEEKTNAKKSQGYSLKPYSLAYNVAGKETMQIEAWFNIGRHYTDETLAAAIDTLIAPVLPTVNEDAILPAPNMHVEDLKPRVYVTIFEEKNASLGDVLKLVGNLESCVEAVRKQAGLKGDKIASDVVVSFNEVKPAHHAKGLSVFGIMPAPQSTGPVTRVANDYTTSVSRTTNM